MAGNLKMFETINAIKDNFDIGQGLHIFIKLLSNVQFCQLIKNFLINLRAVIVKELKRKMANLDWIIFIKMRIKKINHEQIRILLYKLKNKGIIERNTNNISLYTLEKFIVKGNKSEEIFSIDKLELPSMDSKLELNISKMMLKIYKKMNSYHKKMEISIIMKFITANTFSLLFRQIEAFYINPFHELLKSGEIEKVKQEVTEVNISEFSLIENTDSFNGILFKKSENSNEFILRKECNQSFQELLYQIEENEQFNLYFLLAAIKFEDMIISVEKIELKELGSLHEKIYFFEETLSDSIFYKIGQNNKKVKVDGFIIFMDYFKLLHQKIELKILRKKLSGYCKEHEEYFTLMAQRLREFKDKESSIMYKISFNSK